MKHIICKKDVLRNHKIFRFTCATTFSDGVSTVEQTVVEAIQQGLVSVGISDHSFTDFDQCYCMRQERLQEYCCEVRRVRNLYKDRLSSLMMYHVKMVPCRDGWAIDTVSGVPMGSIRQRMATMLWESVPKILYSSGA